MDALLTTLALAIPVLLGGLWLNRLIPAQVPARAALVWGNGTLMGLILIPQFMWVLNKFGVPLSFTITAALGSLLIVVAVILNVTSNRSPYPPAVRDTSPFLAMPLSHQILFFFLLAWLLLRCATLGLEILWRPLFPWDATMHWATKSRVWYEFTSIVGFVDNVSWLNMRGANVFTDQHPYYPHTIPLLQVWMNLAIGRWDESLMNLPWILCLVAMGMAFYSQLRVTGANPLFAIGFTYLLMSMPLINIHVALAGYADLFLGATYCAGLMAFHNWLQTRCKAQGVIALFFAIACMLVKDEGLPWASSFVPALLLALPTRHKAAKLAILFVLAITLLSILVIKNPVLIAKYLRFVTEFHPDGLKGTVQAVWLHDNLHLLGYLLLAIIPMGLIIPGAFTKTYVGISVALACSVAMFLFLFLFTVFGAGASKFTGVGRLYIQLAPGLLFLSAMLCNDILTRDKIKRSSAIASLQG